MNFLTEFWLANQQSIKLALSSALFSLLPILIWAAIFLYKHGEKQAMVVKAFSFGGIMVLPFILYRKLWDFFPFLDINNIANELSSKPVTIFHISLSIPIGMAIMLLSLGALEEFLKHIVANSIDKAEITSIDDAIEFSILAALGFAFAENTFYFIHVWQNSGTDILFKLVLFRSLFSTFAHVLCSSIYGYHFGLSLLAKPILQESKDDYAYKKIIFWIHKKLKLETYIIYKDFQLFLGLFLASVLHGIYNILLELHNTVFLVPFLIIGFTYVMKLISDEKNLKDYVIE